MKKITGFHYYFAVSFVLFGFRNFGIEWIEWLIVLNWAVAMMIAAYKVSK